MIVDVIFTVVLALTGTVEGKTELVQTSFAFQTRAACQSFRGERIDFVNDLSAEQRAGKTYYISECTAVPVTTVN